MTSAPSTAPAARADDGGSGVTRGRGPEPERGPDRPTAKASLLDAVTDLRRDVATTAFPLPLEDVEVARRRRGQLLDQLDDHLLPRLRELSAPAVVVVAGSTGAGKSTLVNSLLGEEVSAAGVLRPTTRRPVLVHHPDDAVLLEHHPLLGIVDVVARPAVPRGLALVDAPDLDSLLAENRSTAHRLLEAADLWVFVTTAARYGDALPWEVLERAAERGTSMAMVLNRVPDDAMLTVRADLMGRLRERGMAAVPLFLVPDVGPHEGLLAVAAVAPMLRWLTMVAGPDRARSVIARTQRGSLLALRPWVDELAEAVQAQVDARIAIDQVVARAVEGPAARARASVASGAVADGPLRGRWTALAGRAGPLGGRWGARRAGSERVEALDAVAQDLAQAARVALSAARRHGSTAVAEALAASEVPGAAGLLDDGGSAGTSAAEPTRSDPGPAAPVTAVPVTAVPLTAVPLTAAPLTPEADVDAWLAAGRSSIEALLADPDRALARRAARLVATAGAPGAATVLGAAATGVGAALVTLQDALGAAPAQQLAGRLGDDLAERAAGQARAGAHPAELRLASADLADDAASRLRLRLAVLKALT